LVREVDMDEIERVSNIIGDIYDASLDPGLWPAVLESIARYVQTIAASIHCIAIPSHTS